MTIEEYQELIALLEELAEEKLLQRKTSERCAEEADTDTLKDWQLEWAAKYGVMYSRIERAIRNVKGTHVIAHLE